MSFKFDNGNDDENVEMFYDISEGLFPGGDVNPKSEIPKAAVFLLTSLAIGVASLSFCSRSVSTTLFFILSFMVGRAAIGCFHKNTVKLGLEKYTWISASYNEVVFVLMPTIVFETAYGLQVQDIRRFRLQVSAPLSRIVSVQIGSMYRSF